jgi:hypothetical protein
MALDGERQVLRSLHPPSSVLIASALLVEGPSVFHPLHIPPSSVFSFLSNRSPTTLLLYRATSTQANFSARRCSRGGALSVTTTRITPTPTAPNHSDRLHPLLAQLSSTDTPYFSKRSVSLPDKARHRVQRKARLRYGNNRWYSTQRLCCSSVRYVVPSFYSFIVLLSSLVV